MDIEDDYVPPRMLMPTPEQVRQMAIARFKKGTGEQTAQARTHARHWKLVTRIEETQDGHILGSGISEFHLVCSHDNQSIWRLQSGGSSFATTIWDIECGLIRHLMQCHREEIGLGDGAEELGHNEKLDASSIGDPPSERNPIRSRSQAKGGDSKGRKGRAGNTH